MLAAVIAAAAVIFAAAVVAAGVIQTAAAEQENQNDDDPKTVVAISAEHKLNLSPHGKLIVAVPIVREWKHSAFVMIGWRSFHPQYTMPILSDG